MLYGVKDIIWLISGPLEFALLIAAALSWVVGNLLRKRTAQTVIDKVTGKERVLDRATHRLFFIPMHFWGVILGVIGVMLCIMEFIQ